MSEKETEIKFRVEDVEELERRLEAAGVVAAIGPIAAKTCRRLGLEVAVEPADQRRLVFAAGKGAAQQRVDLVPALLRHFLYLHDRNPYALPARAGM